ncbi:hypothetical protein FACS1894202_08040 [Clostridia bacterium]|nr:hypothetical protein FACS1894202_08040 [Clostridia bacterium]
MRDTDELRLAVLIDADNAPPKSLAGIMPEIAVLGTPTIKRIYGDWTLPNLVGWKKKLLEYAITPIQQYGYTTGKNSTDSAMIIDAMDILYSERVDGFCLVSSDSDFTRLAIRLREAGMKVIGIGERKTPKPFIVSCDKFIYVEVLSKEKAEPVPVPALGKPQKAEPVHAAPGAPEPKLSVTQDIIGLIAMSVDDVADDEGWAYLGEVGTLLLKKMPDFDSRNFGFKKLSSLIKSLDSFDIEYQQGGDANGSIIMVRVKRD